MLWMRSLTSSTERLSVAKSLAMLTAVLPRLGDVARVHSYRPEVSFGTGCQAGVERHPFELSLEVLAEAALARLPEPRHLTEVDASGYGKITNPGLDEELLERLVNLLRGKGKSTT